MKITTAREQEAYKKGREDGLEAAYSWCADRIAEQAKEIRRLTSVYGRQSHIDHDDLAMLFDTIERRFRED